MEDNLILRLENVGMAWDSGCVLDDVTFDVSRGDFVAISGPNGGGKTTLLRIILGLVRPTSGHVIWFGPDGSSAGHRPTIGYLPQKNMVDSSFPITVEEVIGSGLLAHGRLPVADKCDRTECMLSLTGLVEKRKATIGELSGGQLQRAMLGRALVSDPEVVVLDEPLSYVDKAFEHRIYDIVGDMAGKKTVILVSHEMTAIEAMASRRIVIDHRVVENRTL